MAAVVVGKGDGDVRPRPPSLLFTLKEIPFQANSYDCGWVCPHGKYILHNIAKMCNSNDYNIVIDTIIM